jgi:hypothetical protein
MAAAGRSSKASAAPFISLRLNGTSAAHFRHQPFRWQQLADQRYQTAIGAGIATYEDMAVTRMAAT